MKYDRKYPKWFIGELVSEHDKFMSINGTLSTNAIVEFKCEKHDIIYRQRVKSHITLSTGEMNCDIEVIDINQSNELYGAYHLLGKLY